MIIFYLYSCLLQVEIDFACMKTPILKTAPYHNEDAEESGTLTE